MEIPFLEPEAIERKAYQLCRRAFGQLPQGPLDLERLVYDYLYEQQGVAFYNDQPLGDDDAEDVLGVTYPLRNEIHVDSRLATSGHRGRYRFTVAHEIGHWVLHRPLFLQSQSAREDAQLVTLQRDVEPDRREHRRDYRPEEWQANQFAIFLLLNDPALQTAFETRFQAPPVQWEQTDQPGEEMELRQFSRELATQTIGGEPSLSELFELSAEATAIALEERGYVVDAES